MSHELTLMMKGIIFVSLYMSFLFAVLGVFLFLVWRYIKKRLDATTACWSSAAEQLGLDYGANAADQNALISGELEGRLVKVGMTLHAKQSARDVHRKLYRAGTRVQVSTTSELELIYSPSAQQKMEHPNGWTEHQGVSEGYKVWVPQDGEAKIPTEILQKLEGVSIPFRVEDGQVCWWKSVVEKDSDRLVESIKSCLSVAIALESSP